MIYSSLPLQGPSIRHKRKNLGKFYDFQIDAVCRVFLKIFSKLNNPDEEGGGVTRSTFQKLESIHHTLVPLQEKITNLAPVQNPYLKIRHANFINL